MDSLEYSERIETAQSAPTSDALINRIDLTVRDLKVEDMPAPENGLARLQMVTKKGLEHLPMGIVHAAEDAFSQPLRTAEIIGTSALIGAALKTILPRAGTPGKIAALGIGAYFTYETARPIAYSYGLANKATTMKEMNQAGRILGDAAGSIAVNSLIAGGGFKLGAASVESVLSSNSFSQFNAAKDLTWKKFAEALEKEGKPLDANIVTGRPGHTSTGADAGRFTWGKEFPEGVNTIGSNAEILPKRISPQSASESSRSVSNPSSSMEEKFFTWGKEPEELASIARESLKWSEQIPLESFDAKYHREIPIRHLVFKIERFDGATMHFSDSATAPKMALNANGDVFLTIPKNLSLEAKTEAIAAASYARMIAKDSTLFQPARDSVTDAQIRKFADSAFSGARAYLRSEKLAFNDTSHALTDRFGPVSTKDLERIHEILGRRDISDSAWKGFGSQQ